GRVEVTGPESLVVSARLNAYGEDGTLLSTAIEPVVSAASLVPAGQAIHLQGLANTADAVTRWGVITAGDRRACSLAAYRARRPRARRPLAGRRGPPRARLPRAAPGVPLRLARRGAPPGDLRRPGLRLRRRAVARRQPRPLRRPVDEPRRRPDG